MGNFAEEMADGAQEMEFHGKCSWFKCKKEINGTGYTDQLLADLGFVFCSRDCMKEDLKYIVSEEAIMDSSEVFEILSQ